MISIALSNKSVYISKLVLDWILLDLVTKFYKIIPSENKTLRISHFNWLNVFEVLFLFKFLFS